MKKFIALLMAMLICSEVSAQNTGSKFIIDDDRTISYLLVDEKPKLDIDGIENSMDYILSLVNWRDQEICVSGSFTASFVVTKSGKTEQITIRQKLVPEFDNEAERVLRSLPD